MNEVTYRASCNKGFIMDWGRLDCDRAAVACHWSIRRPGDIVVDKPNVKIYFPIVTCLVISVVGSLILFLIQHFRK